jgi:hypothetical protein
MIEVKKLAAQGDVLFRRVKVVPVGFVKEDRSGPVVVAHSETGHHHEIEDLGCFRFTSPTDPMTAYLQLGDCDGGVSVVHKRAFDTHETLKLLGQPGDVWQVRRQREWAPEGWRRVED